MQVRLRQIRRLRRDEYRMTLDLIDPERGPWNQGDSSVQVDLLDAPGQHYSTPRGLLKPAVELYRMAPDEPPTGSEARLLWDMGEAVYRFVDRVFEGGLLCPSKPPGKKDAQEAFRRPRRLMSERSECIQFAALARRSSSARERCREASHDRADQAETRRVAPGRARAGAADR